MAMPGHRWTIDRLVCSAASAAEGIWRKAFFRGLTAGASIAIFPDTSQAGEASQEAQSPRERGSVANYELLPSNQRLVREVQG